MDTLLFKLGILSESFYAFGKTGIPEAEAKLMEVQRYNVATQTIIRIV